MHLSILQRERREQIRQLRALRDHLDDSDAWWGRIQSQFGAASTAKAFADEGARARGLTKASSCDGGGEAPGTRRGRT